MKRLFIIMTMLVMITANSRAQSLSVANIEAQTGEETELVVSLMEGASMTALQFNLALPEGMTMAERDVTLGAATNGHTLNVETLDNGDHLFVLYSMDLNSFKDGELMRIPVKAGSKATSNGRLYTVRTATAGAVSHKCEETTFNVTVCAAYTLGDVNGDGSVSVTDVTMTISHILGRTPDGFNAAAADVNGDGSISVTDVTTIISIILGNK